MKSMDHRYQKYLITIFIIASGLTQCASENILMVTMGGTKSHKIPFWELARGLISRGHNITFLSGFPADFHINGLVEITPTGFVQYIQNYTNWDLLGRRMRNQLPVPLLDIMRYPIESCDALLDDHETKDLMNSKFNLLILDGAFPECALGLQYKYKVPFMYINTVGYYTGSTSLSGSPAPYSITPHFTQALTDDMNFFQRVLNSGVSVLLQIMHMVTVGLLQNVVRKHLGDEIPPLYELSKNVSFILQNSHFSVSYPRPFMPNVAEIACIHCKPAQPLPNDLEDFINGSGETGFVYVSMGSSVKAANMPENLRQLLVNTFAKLPYRVLWKYESAISQNDLPSNVKISRWLPQQDILGHKKLRAFITHGGLLSLYETIYHGVPAVVMPVFCDHDSNSEKAKADGYALKLHLETLTSEKLFKAVHTVIHDKKYRREAKYRQSLLRDQKTSPLETAIYWTEYVIRHEGAYHLQTPGRYMGFFQYYSFDVLCFFILLTILIKFTLKRYIIKNAGEMNTKLKMQ
ncbi:CLUMA_CG005208, isoform A [Clunio marinus]|uniref:UDP-glucuronosyltransferase n=1 Tax=Clunio marinus TaxID=568069 RepID=A0A1J1HU02_9DIPT|nr:CLUMA_CG005208, isoform A [Clunio marinus]